MAGADDGVPFGNGRERDQRLFELPPHYRTFQLVYIGEEKVSNAEKTEVLTTTLLISLPKGDPIQGLASIARIRLLVQSTFSVQGPRYVVPLPYPEYVPYRLAPEQNAQNIPTPSEPNKVSNNQHHHVH